MMMITALMIGDRNDVHDDDMDYCHIVTYLWKRVLH